MASQPAIHVLLVALLAAATLQERASISASADNRTQSKSQELAQNPASSLSRKYVKLGNNTSQAGKQHHVQHQQQQHHLIQLQAGQPQIERRVGLLEKVCIGTSNRLSSQRNKTDHYQNLVERYKNCTYVIGNLELTWLDRHADLSFLSSIREITGHLLVAYVEVQNISMPNLQIIRGRDLFKLNNEQKEEFALIMIENELKSIQLPNLREILAGSVGSYNNRNLCYIRTINWDEILNWPMYRSVFVYNDGTGPECPPCNQSCQSSSCWADGADMCQKFSKTNCAPQCSGLAAGGRCYGPAVTECCHAYCAGGCVGPKQSDCLACKNFYDDGECIQECPSMMRYNPSKFLWEANPNGKYAFGATCVRECPDHLLRDNGACVRTCPPNKQSKNGECIPCAGPCEKQCQGVEVVHSGNIDQLINCTVIDGSITILDTSFTGYAEVYPNNTIGTRFKPMHPSRLEVFKTLEEITGYLSIQANHPDFKNLSYFRNLKTVGGSQFTDMFQSLSIIKTSLVSLNFRSLSKIKSGKVVIEENKDLCFADSIDWSKINITKREDITVRNNGDTTRCRNLGLRCHNQCGREGCWGPGPDECLSCTNYKVDDYCVDNCTSTQQLGFLSYDSGDKTCKKCHSECKHGCNGTEARQCWSCKNLRDGPHCVSSCPKHKFNNRGTCEECDKRCVDGCTGPSNKLGDGGCNSCGKAVINSTNPFSAYCIQADDICPEGYYQEYIGPQAEGLLKSSSGRPVCRKCHHRCKSCTGMGTHVSVCMCAKYVAGEQCEDSCPRDYYADERSRQCVRCSSECNGCFGPTEADCITCRVYRIYPDQSSPSSVAPKPESRQQIKFNCTGHCPPEKPHRISDSNMLDPYCSEDPGLDLENPRVVPSGSTSFLFMLIIVVAIMICISVYRCQIEKDKTVKLTMRLSGFDDVEPLNQSNMKPNLAPLRSIKETELRRGRELGRGFGGIVFQGFWVPHGHKESTPVAIKILKDNGSSNKHKEFLDEAYIMASVNHPNLVRLLAVCITPDQFMLVTQLMPLGCLLEYVKNHKNDIGAKNLLEWSKQIAKGMAYLEERRMVHRDLALRNVLLQTSGKALISDFGLAKFLEVDQSEYHSGGGRLPIKWLAPECIWERKFTHKSDVWAFGVTIWELLSFGKKPFENIDSKQVPEEVKNGARLEQPKYTTMEVYRVMFSCWFYNPVERPDFKCLAQDFVNFARDPERYLTVGSQGIRYGNSQDLIRNSDSEENGAFEDYGSDMNIMNDEGSQPRSAIPDLACTGHHRFAAQHFDFEMLHQGDPSTPVLASSLNKFPMPNAVGRNLITDGLFSSESLNQAIPQAVKSPALDMNNNEASHRANSCLPSHYGVSTSTLRLPSSCQPTDHDDYLLPSPCSTEDRFSKFLASHKSRLPPTLPHSRDPPHSAGLIGINNDEYFMTRPLNYINATGAHSTNTSSGHIPTSLV